MTPSKTAAADVTKARAFIPPDEDLELPDEPLLLEQAMIDPTTLTPHPGNPRQHAEVEMKAKMKHFGLYRAVTVNKRTGQLVAGHGTVKAFIAAYPGRKIQVSYVDEDPVTADEMLIWDNRSSDMATNEPRLLAEMLGSFESLDWTGFDPGDLDELLKSLPPIENPDEDGEPSEPGPEDAIALAGVVMGEPPITTKHGDVWRLGQHYLVVADVHTDWRLFVPLLAPGSLFWPYPTLLAPFADKAKAVSVVLVQPSTYLAGWLLVKWQRITGKDPVLAK